MNPNFYQVVLVIIFLQGSKDDYHNAIAASQSAYNTWAQVATHTYTHKYIHTYIHAYIHTYIHTYIHAYIRIFNYFLLLYP